ncbi:MAG: hypothetical protein ABSG38_12215 [Spirochaetia bacterium]
MEPSAMSDVLKRLFDGFSTQNRTAAATWIALAIVSAVAIITPLSDDSIILPLISAKVQVPDLFPAASIVISLLIVAYGSSNSQATRTRKLIQKHIDESKEKVDQLTSIYLQDVFDAVATPSINRVAPIAQILQGKYQFFPDADDRPQWMRIVTAVYFILLRSLGILAIEGIPLFALVDCFLKGKLLEARDNFWGIPEPFFWFAGAMGSLVIIELIYFDIKSGVGSVVAICRKPSKPLSK